MKTKPQKIILGAAIVLVGVAGVLAYQNRTTISDWFSGFSYTATPEMSSLEQSIDLTGQGTLILHATHPSLEGRETFNSRCDSHDEKISILGCYVKNHIYLYDINEDELPGVRESTLAHELLHAAWERLSSSEKNNIAKNLTAVYNDEKYHDLLSEDLENYEDADRVDELHSRIGTEIKDLPEALESHYAKYFKNQDAVVDFYDGYITPFRELSKKIDELSAKIQSLDSEIEEKTKAYYAAAEQLSVDIDEFNNCANTSGCFASETAFRTKRNELVSRKASLDEEYESVNNKIKEYNKLIQEYNDSVVHGQTLESMINSNANVEEIK